MSRCPRARAGAQALSLGVAAVLVGVSPGGSISPTSGANALTPVAPALATAGAGGRIATGTYHTCALLVDGSVHCWGYGGDGALGYGNTNNVGERDTPAAAGPVDLGAGHTATAITAGDYHTCALLDDGTVECWGFGGDGRLGYGNTNSVGAATTPASAGRVDLGQPALAISAGGGHTCAILADHSVRCWGYAENGELGYGSTNSVLSPASAGPVDLGPGRTAVAIASGERHTCAILDDGSVECWGNGGSGRLGYGGVTNVGDTPATTPASVGPVDLGQPAVAISAGGAHTCAILLDGSVRCWGFGATGQLGYGSADNVGDTPANLPDTAGAVDLGPGRTAVAISAGQSHTCAVLDEGSVECWGYGGDGRLGYGNTEDVGIAGTPASAGTVDLGAGRTALGISAGGAHTCALLDNQAFRCWGAGAYGRLGYCSDEDVGDDETPGSAGPVNIVPRDGGTVCPVSIPVSAAGAGAPPVSTPPSNMTPRAGAEAERARRYRACVGAVRTGAKWLLALAHRGSMRRRARARRRLAAVLRRGRAHCARTYGRTPGRVTGLSGHALGRTRIELEFEAPGTDGGLPPPARSFLVKEARGPLLTARAFADAPALCGGACRFDVTEIGEPIVLTITDLRPRTTYAYAVAARDDVTGRPGPRSRAVHVRTG